MGDKVTILVVSANLYRRQLDYEWVLVGDKPAKEKEKKEKKKK
jgi:ribonuclease R